MTSESSDKKIDASEGNTPEGMVQCEVTGKWIVSEDSVSFQGKTVSAEGKNILLRQLHGDTPPPEETLRRPSIPRRFFFSLIVDPLILFAAAFAIIYVLSFFFPLLSMRLSYADYSNPFFALFVGVPIFLYYFIMHAVWGQTLGKMLGGYKVVKDDGSPISTGQAFLRAFWFYGPQLLARIMGWYYPFHAKTFVHADTVLSLASGLVLLFDSGKNRALHDFLSGTRVVMVRSPAPEDTKTPQWVTNTLNDNQSYQASNTMDEEFDYPQEAKENIEPATDGERNGSPNPLRRENGEE